MATSLTLLEAALAPRVGTRKVREPSLLRSCRRALSRICLLDKKLIIISELESILVIIDFSVAASQGDVPSEAELRANNFSQIEDATRPYLDQADPISFPGLHGKPEGEERSQGGGERDLV